MISLKLIILGLKIYRAGPRPSLCPFLLHLLEKKWTFGDVNKCLYNNLKVFVHRTEKTITTT